MPDPSDRGSISTFDWLFRRWSGRSLKHAARAQILVDVGTMNSFARCDDFKILTLRRRRAGQTPGPNQRHANYPPVNETRGDRIFRHLDAGNARLIVRHKMSERIIMATEHNGQAGEVHANRLGSAVSFPPLVWLGAPPALPDSASSFLVRA